uniref:NADH dehydrogenase subunit 4 n=1 Tax=Ophiothrix exigua TaxID=1815227 RepID=UPI00286CD842|nr:NADH dehydrogenase subunit 4 [Ophiothrix exigua]WKW95562.1 NADH dehydrogenase subunit 4 [Ophiothrix exigua]
MITIILTTTAAIILIAISPPQHIWPNSIFWASIIILLSLINLPPLLILNETAWGLNNDTISTPLIYLSVWLTPVAIIASAGHLSNESPANTKIFLILILTILVFLIITFTANNLIALFLGFEGTLIPTLFLITRWGAQQERIEAGIFFVFYTLISSLPLFIGLLYLNFNNYSLSILISNILDPQNINSIITITCLIAFLVKVPIFTLHLWLPKAHVEAPVAGSMILAAILLKMGGYGFFRLISLFYINFNTNISNFIVPLCIWGGLLTSVICLTQTDLKSLIAYSSVSHMSFMIAGISTLTQWALAGGLVIMIAHGLVSSALFCIANTYYERSSTRNLFVNRGTKLLFALTPSIWLILSCANMGLPPLPNAVGETIIISTLISSNLLNSIPIFLGVIATGIFSLIMFLAMNSGSAQHWQNINKTMNERENNTLAAHIIPLVAIILAPNIITP